MGGPDPLMAKKREWEKVLLAFVAAFDKLL